MSDTIVRDAVESDMLYIDSLRKKEGAALGFIPINTYMSVITKAPVGGRRRHLYSRLLVTVDNDDLTGFCFATFSQPKAHIFQIVVQEDARRWQRALLMANEIELDARIRGKTFVTCRVAYDLDSNLFWRAIGYNAIAITTSTWLNRRESKSRRQIIVYEKVIQKPLFNLDDCTVYVPNSIIQCAK
jgi:predicted GNAT superfamily acetyltransferase